MPRLSPLGANRATLLSVTAWAAGLLLISSIAPVLRGQAPTGSIPFTQAQASAGGRLYTQKCASCHGARLDDGVAPPLAGQKFLDAWSVSGRSVDDLFFITRTTMPKNEGGTLASAEYASVLAYILDRNGYPAGDRELPADQNTLSALRLTPPS